VKPCPSPRSRRPWRPRERPRDLNALAADCANDGRYTGLLTAAPLNVRGGVGSTANALALK